MKNDPRKLLDAHWPDINELAEALINKTDRSLRMSPFITYDKGNVLPVAQIMATLLVAVLIARGDTK